MSTIIKNNHKFNRDLTLENDELISNETDGNIELRATDFFFNA